MKLTTLDKTERSLLLFLETCAVDYGGKVEGCRMNSDEFDIAKSWNEKGFIKFGRIKFEDISSEKTHWCELSEDAWTMAHQERRDRGARLARKRNWLKAVAVLLIFLFCSCSSRVPAFLGPFSSGLSTVTLANGKSYKMTEPWSENKLILWESVPADTNFQFFVANVNAVKYSGSEPVFSARKRE